MRSQRMRELCARSALRCVCRRAQFSRRAFAAAACLLRALLSAQRLLRCALRYEDAVTRYALPAAAAQQRKSACRLYLRRSMPPGALSCRDVCVYARYNALAAACCAVMLFRALISRYFRAGARLHDFRYYLRLLRSDIHTPRLRR